MWHVAKGTHILLLLKRANVLLLSYSSISVLRLVRVVRLRQGCKVSGLGLGLGLGFRLPC